MCAVSACWAPPCRHPLLPAIRRLSLSSASTPASATAPAAPSKPPQLDHRVIGADQRLFTFRPCCAGQALMLPHGQRIFNRLLDLLRHRYAQTGYDEVSTPLVYSNSLWKTSGHYQHYRDDMFTVGTSDGGSHAFGEVTDTVEDDQVNNLGLKPMNCPAHCIIYDHEPRSYRDLPLRLAEFSPLHRNEPSGGLGGLTRLRRFHQDDAHIFCRPDQMVSEVIDCLDAIHDVYTTFGFEYSVRLSTRPSDFMGAPEVWDVAEGALRSALAQTGCEWTLNEGDGAFYGPKIDITITDAMNRQHQCATVQLDFQLPERFDLSYTDTDGSRVRPVMIHRAILGSVERMMAILIEHTGGKWPFWLSPRQVCVCPVSTTFREDAHEVARQIRRAGFFVDIDDADETLGKRLRSAQLLQYNFMVVMGAKDRESGTIQARSRQGELQSHKSVNDFVQYLRDLERLKQ